MSEKVPSSRPWFKHWPAGVPKHLTYPMEPLPYLLETSAGRTAGKVAFKSGGKSITFRKLSRDSSLFASALRSMGLRAGDRVLFLLPNLIEFVVCFYGVLKAGCTAVTLNHLAKEAELSRVLDETKPKAAVVLSSLASSEFGLLASSKINIVTVGKTGQEGSIELGELLSKVISSLDLQTETRAPAVIQYTGATTGAPKPVAMSGFNLLANAVQNATWFGWDENEVVMGVLPLCHTWGCSCCMNSPIYVGASTILVSRFDPDHVLQMIERERATVLYGSATMFAVLLNYPEFDKYDLSSLRWVKAGAMPIPLELKRRWDKTTGIEMILGYGLTEASPETHDSPPDRVMEGTIGIPIVDTDARIIDVETGSDAETGKPGELLVKGPQVTNFGYLDQRGETTGILENGWLHTGDIALMDSDGYFTLLDRKKDIIKCKGYTIYPVELEDILYELPGVEECAVVGKKHSEYGEIPKAFIVCKKGADLTSECILSFCEERISPFKRLREVEFIGELPKTHVGKVLRRMLRRDE